MMNRQQVLDIIAAHKDELRAMGVSSLSLFGSYARDEANEDSDVDLLVEFDGRPIGLFEYAGIQIQLQEWLGVSRVDLCMPEALHDELKDDILREAVRAA